LLHLFTHRLTLFFTQLAVFVSIELFNQRLTSLLSLRLLLLSSRFLCRGTVLLCIGIVGGGRIYGQ